jgi:hypothetical protein
MLANSERVEELANSKETVIMRFFRRGKGLWMAERRGAPPATEQARPADAQSENSHRSGPIHTSPR